MLPWKRRRLELERERERERGAAKAKAQAKAPGKGAGAGAGLGKGALSLRSPARRLRALARARVGGMFRRRRGSLRVTAEDPACSALYLGHAATLQARGDGCTDLPVAKIWSRSQAGRQGSRMRLSVGAQGLRLAPADGPAPLPAPPPRPGHLYLLHRVTHCAADPRLPRVLAWVYRHELRHKAVGLRCHAALLSKPEKARAMARLLHQTAAAALAEFRRLKQRDDARHQGPPRAGPARPAPLRRLLLHPPAPYKPPADRGRSAPRLGRIAEDLPGEEREEQDALSRRLRRLRLDRDRHGPGPDPDPDPDGHADPDPDPDTG